MLLKALYKIQFGHRFFHLVFSQILNFRPGMKRKNSQMAYKFH